MIKSDVFYKAFAKGFASQRTSPLIAKRREDSEMPFFHPSGEVSRPKFTLVTRTTHFIMSTNVTQSSGASYLLFI